MKLATIQELEKYLASKIRSDVGIDQTMAQVELILSKDKQNSEATLSQLSAARQEIRNSIENIEGRYQLSNIELLCIMSEIVNDVAESERLNLDNDDKNIFSNT